MTASTSNTAPFVIDTHTHFVPKSALGPADRSERRHGIPGGHAASLFGLEGMARGTAA